MVGRNLALPLTWPMAYTTACPTVQAEIQNLGGYRGDVYTDVHWCFLNAVLYR